MKKIILSAMALLAFSFANAQYEKESAKQEAKEELAESSIKTDAGTFVKPTDGTWIMEVNMTPDLSGGSIFSLPALNSDLGMVGLKARYFTSAKRAYRISANVAIHDSGLDHVKTESAVGLGYGIEYHQKGAERLSTYYGWEANIGHTCVNDGFGGQTNRMGYGASVFSGFDYYVMPKIYLGAELSYGAGVVTTDPEHGDNVTSFRLAPGITPSLRLGWQF